VAEYVGIKLRILTPNGYHARKSRLYFIVLREDVGKVLSQKAKELQHQLSRLGMETGVRIEVE
jgi:hypothetical protein